MSTTAMHLHRARKQTKGVPRPAFSVRGLGFTLVEVLVVLTIVALLAAIGLPMAELAHKRQQEEALRSALREIRDALDAYKFAVDSGRIVRRADESGYPPTLETLVEGVVDVSDPRRRKIFFLRRVPRDPWADLEVTSASATWGKRNYASEAVTPKPGADVYDVHSLSTQQGMNGVPYSKW